jgi:hypothetical protein
MKKKKIIKLLIALLTLLALPILTNAYPILNIDFEISNNNQVTINSIEVSEKNRETYDMVSESNFRLSFLNRGGITIRSMPFIVDFGDMAYILPGKDFELQDSSKHHFEVIFSKEFEKLQISFEDNILEEILLQNYLCNNNEVCDNYETNLICASDCKTGILDNQCDKELDGICDPDCDEKSDLDCKEKKVIQLEEPKESIIKKYLFFLIVIIVIVIIALISKYKSNKESQKINQIISDARSKGYSTEKIRNHLIKNNISKDKIEKMLK